jgi:hypothetical protein
MPRAVVAASLAIASLLVTRSTSSTLPRGTLVKATVQLLFWMHVSLAVSM